MDTSLLQRRVDINVCLLAPYPSPSIQDIKTSQAYGELLTTKDVQGNQLDKALKIIVRLRKDVDIERKKTTQALSERHAIQTDLDKFRASVTSPQNARTHGSRSSPGTNSGKTGGTRKLSVLGNLSVRPHRGHL
ncbi:MAG: hypothetical protein RR326_04580, partial [Stenotrophomonas sp.]